MELLLLIVPILLLLLSLSVLKPKSTTYHALTPYPILGYLPQFLKNRARFHDWITDVLATTPTATLTFRRLGGLNGIITANPANVEHILRSSFEIYPKGPRVTTILHDFLGHGIFNADGPIWRHQRKTASFEFNTRSLRNFVLTTVQRETLTRLLPLLTNSAANGSTLDLQDVLERYAFDNVCQISFGVDPACLAEGEAGELASGFAQAFKDATNLSAGRFRFRPILAPIATAFAVAAALLIAAAVTLAFNLYRRIARSRPAPTAPADLKPLPPPLRRFTYHQLRRATAGFSPSHRLGQGGFGPVFRGSLPSGQLIAVKLMHSGSLQGEREFQNEISLAAKISAAGSPADRSCVVPPLGYCSSDEHPRRFWQRTPPDDAVDPPPRRLLLVYELMQNGSLQDALLDRRCPDLANWRRRFSIAVDIAQGLHFLHVFCDPPVIHGDIKPSNILLDSCLSARIADFGLARIKTSDAAAASAAQLDEETVIEIALDEKNESPASPEGVGGAEDDASESTATAGIEELSAHQVPTCIATSEKSPDESCAISSPTEAGGFDGMSVDSGTASSSRRGGRKKGGGGKDWWWRQDGVGSAETGATVKDYVMEWIRSEIKKERPKSDWISAPAVVASEDCLPRPDRKKHRRSEWWTSLEEEKQTKKESKSNRPAREWWREEFCEELTNKQKQRMGSKSNSTPGRDEQEWWQKDGDSVQRKKRRKKKSGSHGSRASMDWWMDRVSGEGRQRNSRDWASGDIPRSGTVSSTPSMRGTVCYAAPEYGGGSPLTEKCDIYSFGVLLLVLISGRRPLQVTASPMSEFERANLISWARHLAHLGRLLDLLDPSLQGVDRDQALLCITVALLCIQRSPSRRPTIKEVVMILTGLCEVPHLPLEFSPSPPGGFTFKSRRKVR